MWFEQGTWIKDATGRKTRWQVADWRHDRTLSYLRLHDGHPGVKPPMIRESVGVCINYHGHQVDQWLIEDWRKQFREACEAASGNFTGLPEPVDFFTIRNQDHEVPEHLKEGEPFFIYCYAKFFEVRSMDWRRFKAQGQVAAYLKRFVYDLAYVLRSLHQAGLVLRQLPLTALRWLPTSRRYFIGEFLSLTRQGPSGFHPRIPFLNLDHRFSAPECFDERQTLTPATDVYCLAKSVLLFLGGRTPGNAPWPADPELALATVAPANRALIPEPILRFLRLALRLAPDQRPTSMGEVMGLVSGNSRPQQSPNKPKRPPYSKGKKDNRNKPRF